MTDPRDAIIADLQAQLESIGAGGVEPLRTVKLNDVINRLERGFGAGCAPVTTLRTHFAAEHSTAYGNDAAAYAQWLACLRVSDDGWRKVLDRITQDLGDLAAVIQSGKITAHTPQHLRHQTQAALTNRASCASLL